MQRKPYKHFFPVSRSSAVAQYVADNPVKQGRVRYITAAAISNESGTLDRAVFGLRKRDGFQRYEGGGSQTQYIPERIRKTHHFDAGEIPAWEVTGGTAADVLVALFEGYDTVLAEKT